ncbi:hypothetical protein RintRC_2905 [Richelia intracellularis]|nr:hypothetical protein RintRC_2905 [Richelia intracellularis]
MFAVFCHVGLWIKNSHRLIELFKHITVIIAQNHLYCYSQGFFIINLA